MTYFEGASYVHVTQPHKHLIQTTFPVMASCGQGKKLNARARKPFPLPPPPPLAPVNSFFPISFLCQNSQDTSGISLQKAWFCLQYCAFRIFSKLKEPQRASFFLWKVNSSRFLRSFGRARLRKKLRFGIGQECLCSKDFSSEAQRCWLEQPLTVLVVYNLENVTPLTGLLLLSSQETRAK